MTTPASFDIDVPERAEIVIVAPGPQGPKGNDTLFVSPNKPTFVEPGIWVQTGLGPEGKDFTFWIEDGV